MDAKLILLAASLDEIIEPQVEDDEFFFEAATGHSRAHLDQRSRALAALHVQTWPISITKPSFGLSSSIIHENFPY